MSEQMRTDLLGEFRDSLKKARNGQLNSHDTLLKYKSLQGDQSESAKLTAQHYHYMTGRVEVLEDVVRSLENYVEFGTKS